MNDDEDKTAVPADIPILTDVVSAEAMAAASTSAPEPVNEPPVGELQTQLAAATYELADRLLHAAFQQMEATLFEQVSEGLRKELPELIDRVLREHLEQLRG